jgi:hypothetical protein
MGMSWENPSADYGLPTHWRDDTVAVDCVFAGGESHCPGSAGCAVLRFFLEDKWSRIALGCAETTAGGGVP